MSRILLTADDSPVRLIAMGLSRTTVWRSLKRGWYTLDYHHEELIVKEGIGGFSELKDPYAFAKSQVWHILNIWDATLDASLVEEMVQEGLLKCWELRHRDGVRSWPAFFSTVIRRKVQDLLPCELSHSLWLRS